MKKIATIISFLVLIAVAYGVYMFNKKTESLHKVKPEYTVTANQLYMEFANNEKSAILKYEGKIIEVTGEVIMVTKTDSISNVLLGAEEALLGGVNCSFNELENNLQKGEIITVKGQCQGYLTSVILNNCVIGEN
ncbi:OB-fold protein [Pontimicrobium sp. IMCC45349]|uniref:OB-fold protein n=1 Tax=Pontimicrobium sp. IMCC45349 TaxID=3391574 RepID=UPI0039A0315C